MALSTWLPELVSTQSLSSTNGIFSHSDAFGKALVVCIVALLAFGVLYKKMQATPPAGLVKIESMRFLDSDLSSPPALFDQNSTNVDLPHSLAAGDELKSGWYEANFELTKPESGFWVLYFPRLGSDAEIYVNSQLVGLGSRMEEDASSLWQRPYYITMPHRVLTEGRNVIHVFAEVEPNREEVLYPLHFGPEGEFRQVFADHYFLSVSTYKLICGLLLFTAIGIGFVWYRRRQETLYGWFSLLCGIWAFHTAFQIMTEVPYGLALDRWNGESVVFTALVAVIILFGNRYTGKISDRFEIIVLLFLFGFGVALIGLSVVAHEFIWKNYLMIPPLAALIISSVINLKRIQTSWPIPLVLFCFSLCFFTIGAIADAAGISSTTLGYGPDSYIQFAAPIFIVLVGSQLITDFATARNELEILNSSLESQIAERTLELRTQFKKITEMEKQRVLTDERDRIMQEMHDGIGSHMISMLSLLNRELPDRAVLEQTVRDALHDLRMMIDSLDADENDLSLAFGMYRSRLDHVLAGSEIKLNWQVMDIPEVDQFSPHTVLQVLRIVQEAVTNTIKHAHASTITISTEVLSDEVVIRVEDDGSGWVGDHAQGRGMNNMSKRAESINARFDVSTNGKGVSVQLFLKTKSKDYILPISRPTFAANEPLLKFPQKTVPRHNNTDKTHLSKFAS